MSATTTPRVTEATPSADAWPEPLRTAPTVPALLGIDRDVIEYLAWRDRQAASR